MPAVQTKEDVLRVVQALPNATSLDDVIERLILLRKVNVGLSQEGQGIFQSEAETEFRKPRAERSWNRGWGRLAPAGAAARGTDRAGWGMLCRVPPGGAAVLSPQRCRLDWGGGPVSTPALMSALAQAAPRTLVVTVLVALSACGAGPIATAEAQAVYVQPSSDNDLVFSRERGDVVETVFVNGSDRTVFFASPSLSTALDRWEGGAWVEQPYWYGTIAILPEPAPVGPGEYRPLVYLSLTEVGVRPGRYRIRAAVYEDATWERALPESERVSPSFEVME